MKTLKIDGRIIGDGVTPYVVAELSANHNGSLSAALDSISVAKKCGADAIKLQTYSPDTMTIDSDEPDFLITDGLWSGYKLYDLYAEAQTPFGWHSALFNHARKSEITCFSTPFDESAVDLLEDLGAPAYKIASFEATDLPLVKYAAGTGKPMIVSTGMANLQEIEELIDTAKSAGCQDLVVLHCVSSYPAPVEQSNLWTIPDLRKRFDCLVGLSDHTLTNSAAIAATALGACLIEKHFILDRNIEGPDSSFSIEPEELMELTNSVAESFSALGQPGYDRKPAERGSMKFRRSLYFVEDLEAGAIITAQSIRRIRPGFGLAPAHETALIGKKLRVPVKRGTATSWKQIDE